MHTKKIQKTLHKASPPNPSTLQDPPNLCDFYLGVWSITRGAGAAQHQPANSSGSLQVPENLLDQETDLWGAVGLTPGREKSWEGAPAFTAGALQKPA